MNGGRLVVIKTFITGVVLGIVAVIAALHLLPVVDQKREDSIISVARNGGNTETFHVNVPMDRIMIGAAGQSEPLPPELDWPDDELFVDARAELFKVRNVRDAVVGVASRLAARDPEAGDVIEWVVHLPARGSLFVTMDPQPVDGRRSGNLRAGTREFSDLVGRMSERWVADASDGANAGRIELEARFVSTIMDDDPGLVDAEEQEDAE